MGRRITVKVIVSLERHSSSGYRLTVTEGAAVFVFVILQKIHDEKKRWHSVTESARI
jgi:hypothetical protein